MVFIINFYTYGIVIELLSGINGRALNEPSTQLPSTVKSWINHAGSASGKVCCLCGHSVGRHCLDTSWGEYEMFLPKLLPVFEFCLTVSVRPSFLKRVFAHFSIGNTNAS